MSNEGFHRQRYGHEFFAVVASTLLISLCSIAVASDQRVPTSRTGPSSGSTDKAANDIHSLSFPAETILRESREVDSVRATRSRQQQFTHRIIHIRNWHFLPKDLFAAEFRQINGASAKQSAIDEAYQEFLGEVESVQAEQIRLLRRLIRKHGLKTVYYEGLIEDELPLYRAKIRSLRQLEKSLSEIKFNIQELELLRMEFQQSAEENSARIKNITQIELKLKRVLKDYQSDLLQIGAAGRLLMSGELKDVRPLDTHSGLEQSNPRAADGSLRRVSARTIESREDAQVRYLLKSSGTAVVILGGAHDLTNNVDRLSNGKCQYVRVTTRNQ